MTASKSVCSKLWKGVYLTIAISWIGLPFSYGAPIRSETPQSAGAREIGDRLTLTTNQEMQRAQNYLVGRGVPQDLTQAAYWYQRAAEQGNPEAQVLLSYLYFTGTGVRKDVHQSLLWEMRAVASGSVEAKVNLAAMYLHGDGIKPDSNEALRLLEESAAKRDGRAEAYLGTMYALGLGIPVDRSKAETWFEKGVKHHSAEAEFGLATLEANDPSRPQDPQQQEALLRLSAAKHYVPAMHSLGLLLVNHPDLQRQPGEEVRMLTMAAGSGFWKASAVLGMLTRDGRYLPQDTEASYRWFRIAVLQGGTPAADYLDTTLQLQGKQLGPNKEAIANKAARAWLAAHPGDGLFTFDDGINARYFSNLEAYAAIQALQGKHKEEATN
jgi:uncharacterized protein